jgi:hypothetical protein
MERPLAMAPERQRMPSNHSRISLTSAVVDDVVERDAAVGADGVVHILAGAEGGDDDGHLPLHAELQVLLQAGVALVDDQVHREWRHGG